MNKTELPKKHLNDIYLVFFYFNLCSKFTKVMAKPFYIFGLKKIIFYDTKKLVFHFLHFLFLLDVPGINRIQHRDLRMYACAYAKQLLSSTLRKFFYSQQNNNCSVAFVFPKVCVCVCVCSVGFSHF